MKRKLAITTALVLFALAATSIVFAAAPTRSHYFQFVDEFGQPVNMTTDVSVNVYTAGTTTAETVYRDSAGIAEVNQPITDTSTRTTLEYNTGTLRFWSDKSDLKIVATDGSSTVTYDNLDIHDTKLLWPSTLASPAPSYRANLVVITADKVLTAADSGAYIVSKGAGTAAQIDVNLPTAEAGLLFTVSDANATAVDDVWINAATGDTINGGTAGKSIKCVTDTVGHTITLLAIDSTRWIVVRSVGTWANDNS